MENDGRVICYVLDKGILDSIRDYAEKQ